MLNHSGHTTSVSSWSRARREPAAALFCPRLLSRLLARVNRLELDRALVDGADPAGSPVLAARAAQLAGRSNRERLAVALERVALTVDELPGRVRTLPLRGAVRANRAELLELATILRDGGVLYAGGIAAAELVLIDGTGPAYTDRRGEGLARRLQITRQALTG
jgi:hypothetical protein